MKEYSTKDIRNVALVSHSSAGKTILTEACLHFTGATTRMGDIRDGNTVADFDDEEVRRGISLYTSVIPIEHKSSKINFLDTPGYTDFIGEMISALSVADSAIVVVDSVSGFEVGTEVAWNYCNTFNLPRFLLINKMDRENADHQKALQSVQEYSDIRLIPVQIPWGEKQDFQGVVDLLSMKAYKGDGKEIVGIPDNLKESAESARTELVEAAAEGDDSLLEKYLEGEELTAEEISSGLANVIKERSFIPVFYTAGGAELAVRPLLDAIVELFPSPEVSPPVTAKGKGGEDEELSIGNSGPLAVYVWKTTADPFVGKQTYFKIYSGLISSDARLWNQNKGVEERFGGLYVPKGKETISVNTLHSGDIGVVPKLSETATGNTLCDKTHPVELPLPKYPNSLFQVAIIPKTQADSTKISPSLTKLCEEDMTLSWHHQKETRQTILQGMGDQHIDVAIRRAETKFQVGLLTAIPRVPYKETITKKAEAMYRHKKQSGGSGQFGEVSLRVEPNEEDFEFKNGVFGGAISSSYMPAIEKGIKNVMKEGVIAGFTVTGIKVEVFDGKEHSVDSKPVAFEIAGREAFKLAFKDAAPVLKEPIVKIEVVVPEDKMGDIIGDLNTRRARVQGMDNQKGHSIITANVPLAEILRYTTDLRSITGGRGFFNMEESHYEVVPTHVAQGVIEARQKELNKEG
jgi:elongation factor G